LDESKLLRAAAVIDVDPDETNRLCIEVLGEEPDNPKALFLMGTVLMRAEKWGVAYNLFKRVVDIDPKQAVAWNNLGVSCESLLKYSDARRYFEEAVKKSPKTLDYKSNIAMVLMHEGKYQEASKKARELLKVDPNHPGSNLVNGFSSLALGQWEEGWKGYEYTLGGKFRKESIYQNEDRWQGEETDCLVVYGEQGLGDEIMYSSCIPDLTASEVVVECDERLEGLFRRSFPTRHVYGTRKQTDLDWLSKHTITARCPMGGVPRYVRNKDSDFPRKPFLVADPDRRLQWKALFDSWGKKPKIGLAWSGGRPHTGAKKREVGIDAFRPLIESIDADFISLQYRSDSQKEIEESGLPVHHFKRACQTNDYDDLAGMVAELDMVIGIHTAALHLSGGLGVKTIALVPSKPAWAYNPPEMLWYPESYSFHRQKDGEKWTDTVTRLVKELDHGAAR